MDVNTLSLIASAFIPLIVDLVVRFTKIEAGNAKRAVAIVLAFIVALIPELGVTVPTTDVWEFLKALSVRFGAILVTSQTIFAMFYNEGKLQKVVSGKQTEQIGKRYDGIAKLIHGISLLREV